MQVYTTLGMVHPVHPWVWYTLYTLLGMGGTRVYTT